jgi:O-antigen/teichoic acid export membrane protein
VNFVVAPPFVAYCVGVSLVAPWLVSVVFSPGTTEPALVRLFAVYYFLTYTSLVLGAILMARRRTRRIFVASIGAAVPALIASWPLMERFDTRGAVLAMIMWAVLLNVALVGRTRGATA